MLLAYIQAALRHACYEKLAEDNQYYGEITGFDGIYAAANTLEECRNELAEVLEEWILFRIHKNLPVPVVDGIELAIREVA